MLQRKQRVTRTLDGVSADHALDRAQDVLEWNDFTVTRAQGRLTALRARRSSSRSFIAARRIDIEASAAELRLTAEGCPDLLVLLGVMLAALALIGIVTLRFARLHDAPWWFLPVIIVAPAAVAVAIVLVAWAVPHRGFASLLDGAVLRADRSRPVTHRGARTSARRHLQRSHGQAHDEAVRAACRKGLRVESVSPGRIMLAGPSGMFQLPATFEIDLGGDEVVVTGHHPWLRPAQAIVLLVFAFAISPIARDPARYAATSPGLLPWIAAGVLVMVGAIVMTRFLSQDAQSATELLAEDAATSGLPTNEEQTEALPQGLDVLNRRTQRLLRVLFIGLPLMLGTALTLLVVAGVRARRTPLALPQVAGIWVAMTMVAAVVLWAMARSSRRRRR